MNENKNLEENYLSDFKYFVKGLGVVIPLLGPMIIIYGGVLLLNICLSYNIDFVDMVKVNVLVVFGSASFIITMIISASLTIIIFSQHFTARFLVKNLIYCSKVKSIRRYPIIFLFLGCFLLSSWPYFILLENLTLIIFSMFLIAVVFAMYIMALTKYRTKNITLYKRLIHVIHCLMALFSPMFFGCLGFAIIVMIFQDSLGGVSLFKACMTVSILYYLVIFLTFQMALAYKTHKELTFYCLVFFVCFFMVFSLKFSDGILIKVIGRVGLGFASECYLKSDYEELKIPDVFSRETMSDKIIQLSVVTHLDNIYYLTSNLSPASPAQLRFESEKLKRIGCPPLNNKIISNANGR
ncbi:hypothetical protein C1N60_03115 [Pantoea sp. SGAir0184]